MKLFRLLILLAIPGLWANDGETAKAVNPKAALRQAHQRLLSDLKADAKMAKSTAEFEKASRDYVIATKEAPYTASQNPLINRAVTSETALVELAQCSSQISATAPLRITIFAEDHGCPLCEAGQLYREEEQRLQLARSFAEGKFIGRATENVDVFKHVLIGGLIQDFATIDKISDPKLLMEGGQGRIISALFAMKVHDPEYFSLFVDEMLAQYEQNPDLQEFALALHEMRLYGKDDEIDFANLRDALSGVFKKSRARFLRLPLIMSKVLYGSQKIRDVVEKKAGKYPTWMDRIQSLAQSNSPKDEKEFSEYVQSLLVVHHRNLIMADKISAAICESQDFSTEVKLTVGAAHAYGLREALQKKFPTAIVTVQNQALTHMQLTPKQAEAVLKETMDAAGRLKAKEK